MKKTIIPLLWIIPFWIGGIFGCYNNASKEGRKRNFEAQLGTYILDIERTNLGSYSKDSNIYKKLTITFKADSTFNMNMKVPFMYDSSGRWIAGNMEEWNYLYYKSWAYSKGGTGEQFTRPSMDSTFTFLLNSTTPQKGEEPIQEIYFKKIKP